MTELYAWDFAQRPEGDEYEDEDFDLAAEVARIDAEAEAAERAVAEAVARAAANPDEWEDLSADG
ncbi:MAG: hypothetical protein WA840_12795 [Caulobacteraceae bacterium]